MYVVCTCEYQKQRDVLWRMSNDVESEFGSQLAKGMRKL